LILHKIHVVINTFSASIWSEIKIEEEDAAKQVIIVFILRVIRITDRVRELSLDIFDPLDAGDSVTHVSGLH